MRDVDVGNGDQGVLEVAAGAEEVIGKATLGANQRNAPAEVGPRQPRESRRTEEDGGAVRTGPGGSDAGATHGARVVLVDAKPLPGEGGGEGGDKRRGSGGSGEQQQRKPPHTWSPQSELGRW